jgi:eukaryotic-like serine/threonine-protein kinase
MPEIDDDPFQLAGVTIEGKYRIASVIGDGGFGVVYRGVHLGFSEVIAIKCLKLPHALAESQRDVFLEQLRDEGRLLHRLSKATPGIVQALDVGAVTSPSGAWVPYLVLEWLDGETLADHVQRRSARGQGAFSLEEAIRLLEPAARALGVAHALKVAHRDVKPQNLFVAKVGASSTLKVLDFGIAKVLTEYTTLTQALDSTKQTPTAFTPRYGAPEQFNKQRGATGPWTDVFALALITVELLTGKKALEGDDPTQLYVAAADPTLRPTPRALGADVPEAVDRVLDKALAVDPKSRFPDADTMWDALMDAAGLAPNNLVRVSSPRLSPTGASLATPMTGGTTTEKTVVEGARIPPTRDAAHDPPAAEVDATRPVEALGAGSPASVLVKADPLATAASPGAPPPPPLDPMSETPFFDRHHLPSSTKSRPRAAEDSQASSPAIAAPEAPSTTGQAPARRSKAPWIVAAVVLGGGAVAAWQYAASFELTLKPSPSAAHSASARKKHPLPPPRPHRSAVAPAPSATPSASASASADAGDAGATEPAAPPPDMVLIAPGSFKVAEGGREITIARPFYLDRTEVTANAYARCTDKRLCGAAEHVVLPPETPPRWAPVIEGDSDGGAMRADYIDTWSRRCNGPRSAGDHPINCVDFAAAEAYCKFVGKRLPTEAEWAWAARGAEARPYPWGSDAPECGRACYDKNGGCRGGGQSVATCAAGLHPADRTPEGVYDLGGDVAEWVTDGWAEAPLPDAGVDKASPKRVVRGGSFIDDAATVKATARAWAPAGLSHVGIGFRCAMDAAPAPKP